MVVDVVYYFVYGVFEGFGSVVLMVVVWYCVGWYFLVCSVVLGVLLVLFSLFVYELWDLIFSLIGIEVVLWLFVGGLWVVGYVLWWCVIEVEEFVGVYEEVV